MKLADLGIATQLSSAASARFSVVGTPTHMAPEAIMPHGHVDVLAARVRPGYDNRVDVWSLGITTLFMAEREVPTHQAQDPYELAMRILAAAPPTLRPSTRASAALRRFVARALVKDASERPAAAELAAHEFVAAATAAPLTAWLRGAPSARRSGYFSLARIFKYRH